MRKRENRRAVMLPARLRIDGVWRDVTIRNISSRGMLVTCPGAIARGTYVELHRNDSIVVARAVWRGTNCFGVLAQDRIDIERFVSTSSTPAPTRLRPDGQIERRRHSRDIPAAAERSRERGVLLQFAALTCAGLTMATCAAATVHQLLASQTAAITQAMQVGSQM